MSNDRRKQIDRQQAIERLLEIARSTPEFDGDFIQIAQDLGWTQGKHWKRNPALAQAAKIWRKQQHEANKPKPKPTKLRLKVSHR